MTRKIILWILITNLLLLFVACWRMDTLPAGAALNAALLAEPEQVLLTQPAQRAAFQVLAHGVTYTVQPLYAYDLVGLVVSKHNADSWWDHLHRDWNDSLNIVDLCVVWGNNVRSGAYTDIDFSSGQFTCNFSTRSSQAYAAFDQTAISNNHLLTDDPARAKALRDVRIGDQIHVRGRLSEYSHQQGFAFKRGTSITRTDTGNGACETIFVDDFEVLRPADKKWRTLARIAGLMLMLGVVAWFARPLRFDD